VIALIVVSDIKPAGPGPRNMASDGIEIGKGLVAARTPALAAGKTPKPTSTRNSSATADIRLYTDFLCPACGSFEKQNGDYIEDLVKKGAATVELHPVAILDRLSLGTEYATRSAAAAACVADYAPDSYFEFSKALFARQPAENTKGLPNSELVDVAKGIKGVTNKTKIASCIDHQRFDGWATAATKRALAGPLPGTDVKKLEVTPTVIVNGKAFDSSKQTFKEFMAAQLGDAAGDKASD
jgi:protein-disulfide isomerase